MKRTELKRKTELKRGGALRRTPLKRSAKSTNAKPHKHVPLREQYRSSNATCEYCAAAGRFISEIGRCQGAHDVEHIWQSAGQKYDYWWNFMMACRAAHEWKHRNLVCGRIAASHWKLSKDIRNGFCPGAGPEFRRAEMCRVIGRDPVGLIANWRADGLPAWAEGLSEDIARACSTPSQKSLFGIGG